MRRPWRRSLRAYAVAAAVCVTLLEPRVAQAFWVVNFGTAPPLQPGKVAFAGGTLGAYWYEGRLADVRTSGPAFQYGVVLASVF